MNVSTVLLVIIGVIATTYAEVVNVARGKTARMSSTYGCVYGRFRASKGVDGNTNSSMKNSSCFHTNFNPTNWWYVDLGQTYTTVQRIEVYSRRDCCVDRNKMIAVKIGTSLSNMRQVKYWADPLQEYEYVLLEQNEEVRYVKLVHTANTAFHLCEVKVNAEL
ncbi:fucolectin-1-like isoform X2 [Mercenaria mercenaria]|uniref:fucolectin-1-like isoform X2 n=1 Tax=Mercenaria mercenaria TaxID=6596 RepID=UPI00234E6F9F|nr:fucolectin-1-like isoform X2 [Mercenaria mercenaria]